MKIRQTPPPGSVRPDRRGDASGRSACHMQPSQPHRRESLGGEAGGADGGGVCRLASRWRAVAYLRRTGAATARLGSD
jgi:hypothetical protein